MRQVELFLFASLACAPLCAQFSRATFETDYKGHPEQASLSSPFIADAKEALTAMSSIRIKADGSSTGGDAMITTYKSLHELSRQGTAGEKLIFEAMSQYAVSQERDLQILAGRKTGRIADTQGCRDAIGMALNTGIAPSAIHECDSLPGVPVIDEAASIAAGTVKMTGPRRLFIVDHFYTSSTAAPGLFGIVNSSSGTYHTEPRDRASFFKKCPNVGIWTEDRNAADLLIEVNIGGGSSVINPRGDVLFVAPARTYPNIIKDVCHYLESHS